MLQIIALMLAVGMITHLLLLPFDWHFRGIPAGPASILAALIACCGCVLLAILALVSLALD